MGERDAVDEVEQTGQKEADLLALACVAPAVKRQTAAVTENAEPMIILVISYGSRQRLPYAR